MAINREFIGRTYRASDVFEVGREHVRRFAEAIGDDNPVYVDREAARALGHPDCIAPPTFLTVLNFRFALEGPVVDPEFGLDYTRVVHGEQRFELHRPVRVGDVLQMVSQVEDVKDAGRNELIVMAMEVTAADGEQVATIRSTIVSRGTAAPRPADQEA